MVEVEHLNKEERTAIVERFFKHEKFKRVTGFANCADMQSRVVVLDFAYNKDGALRLSVYLKGKSLDQVFRSVEDVFDGWDCFYWMAIPKSSEVEKLNQIDEGIKKLFRFMDEMILDGGAYWFVIKDVEHFYEFS